MAHPPAPVAEMLWESRDPEVVLEERFGFGDAGSAGRWVARIVHQHWDMTTQRCERIAMSDRNALAWLTAPSGRFLAKWSVAPERFARLSQIARLTQWLDVRGLPVSAPVPTSDGRLHVEVDGVSMCLQRVIDADHLDVDDDDQVRTAGAALARLHRALADYPDAIQVAPPEEAPQPLAARIMDWLESAGDHAPAAGRDALRALVVDAPGDPLLPLQLVHGDYRSSNILCAGSKLAAVIDFEEARLDHCIDEVARSAVILGTRFRDWGPVSAEVRETFLSGYQSVRRLTTVELTWWSILVLWYSLVFVPPGHDPAGWGSAALGHVTQLASKA